MDEEMEYAEMLEIPVSTVNVTKKRGRKPKKQTDLKDKVITKVNEKNELESTSENTSASASVNQQKREKTTTAQEMNGTAQTTEISFQETAPNASFAINENSTPTEAVYANNQTNDRAINETYTADSNKDNLFTVQENAIVSESAPIAIPRRKKRPFLARLFGGKENVWEYETAEPQASIDPFPTDIEQNQPTIYNYNLYQKEKSARDKEKRYSLIVGIEFAACVALCAGIFLTNVFYPSSAINTFFQSLTQNSAADARTYTDFTLSSVLSEENAELNLSPTGILSFTEKGCVYPAVDGTVTEILQNADGTWMVKISHSPTFSEIINGLSYAACSVGSVLKSNVPVGYSNGDKEVQVSMYDDGALLNCFYVTENGNLAWTED